MTYFPVVLDCGLCRRPVYLRVLIEQQAGGTVAVDRNEVRDAMAAHLAQHRREAKVRGAE